MRVQGPPHDPDGAHRVVVRVHGIGREEVAQAHPNQRLVLDVVVAAVGQVRVARVAAQEAGHVAVHVLQGLLPRHGGQDGDRNLAVRPTVVPRLHDLDQPVNQLADLRALAASASSSLPLLGALRARDVDAADGAQPRQQRVHVHEGAFVVQKREVLELVRDGVGPPGALDGGADHRHYFSRGGVRRRISAGCVGNDK